MHNYKFNNINIYYIQIVAILPILLIVNNNKELIFLSMKNNLKMNASNNLK